MGRKDDLVGDRSKNRPPPGATQQREASRRTHALDGQTIGRKERIVTVFEKSVTGRLRDQSHEPLAVGGVRERAALCKRLKLLAVWHPAVTLFQPDLRFREQAIDLHRQRILELVDRIRVGPVLVGGVDLQCAPRFGPHRKLEPGAHRRVCRQQGSEPFALCLGHLQRDGAVPDQFERVGLKRGEFTRRARLAVMMMVLTAGQRACGMHTAHAPGKSVGLADILQEDAGAERTVRSTTKIRDHAGFRIVDRVSAIWFERPLGEALLGEALKELGRTQIEERRESQHVEGGQVNGVLALTARAAQAAGAGLGIGGESLPIRSSRKDAKRSGIGQTCCHRHAGGGRRAQRVSAGARRGYDRPYPRQAKSLRPSSAAQVA